MKSKLFRLLALCTILALTLSPLNVKPTLAVTGPTTDEPTAAGSPASPVVTKGIIGGASDTGLYIIQLRDASLAAYRGGLAGYPATSTEVTGARKLDVKSPASQAYLGYLNTKQNDFIAQMGTTLGRSVEVTFQYLNVLNALAVRVSFDEAVRLSKLAQVKAVFADKNYQLDTDVGPEWIGAPAIWTGETGPGVETQGEGIIVGMIDSGINHAHPSFAAVGGDGYTHTDPYGAGVFKGYCVANPSFCNDKLIGAYDLYPGGSGGPEDGDGHGSHTASTVAGNHVEATILVGATPITRTISGVAPHANLIAYKVCSPSCPGSSSIEAVNLALGDQVDVLNYSISGSDDPWNDPVDLAFLDATDGGIFVSASAGNAGPGAGTVAHTGPWNATVAASTHTRIFANTLDITAPTPVPPGLVGLAAVQGTGPALPADLTALISYDPANLNGCVAFSGGFFTNKLALVQRGTCNFSVKVTNAQNAGAVGVIVFNNAGGPPIVMGSLGGTTVPSAMVSLGDGLAVKAWIDANPTTAQARLNLAVNVVVNPEFADIMASFSSRGPSQFDLLKPDYTAPGVNILAAYAASGGNPDQYALLQGTSMSSPHSAGSAVLMTALHPDWTPVEIKSALASSAFNGPTLFKENAVTPADPFDLGSGRLALGAAATAGLVWDETYANFVAANPGIGGDPRLLNLSTLINRNCVGNCTWTRTVKSVLDVSATYTASFTSTVGIVGTVTPSVFTIPAGGTQELVITVDVSSQPLGTWVFGTFNLETDAVWAGGQSAADQHMTMAAMPALSNIPDLVTIKTDKKTGSKVLSGLQVGEAITDLTVGVDGMNKAALFKPMVAQDPTPADPFNGDGGTFVTTLDVPSGALRLVAQIMESTSLDVDLYVGTGTTPSQATTVCASATSAVLEYCNIDNPAPGTYWVLAQNWAGSGAPTDLIATAVGTVVPGDAGNLTVTGPQAVLPGVPFDLSVNWMDPNLVDQDVFYGVFTVGTDPGNPGNLGRVAVNFSYTQPVFISKQGPSSAFNQEVVPYTIVMNSAAGIGSAAFLTDTLPTGVEFAGGLAATAGTAMFDDATNSVYWTNTVLDKSSGKSNAKPAAPRPVTLSLGSAPASGKVPNAAAPNGPISLVLDDGSIERAIGLNGGGFAFQYLWFNRFTPAAGDFPFALNQIDIYFTANSGANPGDPIDLVVYQDLDGDPTNGAELLRTIPTTVQAVEALNSYDLSADPVVFSGPGDVFIGAIDRYVVSGVSPANYPSAQDSTSSQQRSWIAAWTNDPPDPAVLPADVYYDVIDNIAPTLAGNWIIRGSGATIAPQVITVTFNVTVTAGTDALVTNVADLTYNGDPFNAETALTVVAPPTAAFTSNTPVQLGQTAQFTSTVTGTAPFTYLWNFGDNITSTLASPTHLFGATGTYTVTLKVTNAFGTATVTHPFVVRGIPPGVTFTSNSPILLGEEAVFTPTVTGTGPFEYLWDFGDGVTSTLASPTHMYATAGTFTVTLTVTSEWGSVTTEGEFEVVSPIKFVYLPLVFKGP